MHIDEKVNSNFVTLSPVGELDASSSLLLDEKLNQWIEQGRYNFHIDCSDLSYISSAGLGVFISYLDTIKEHGGKIVFSELSPVVSDVFKLLGLNQIVPILNKEEEASAQFIT